MENTIGGTAAAETVPAAAVPTRRRRGLLFWGTATVATGVLALLAVAVLHPAQDSPLRMYTRNTPAPDFTMALYGGGRLHLAALRGKTVVLNFWWSGCVPCQEEAPLLERQWRAWKDRGVVFIGMDEIDDPHTSTPYAFLKKYGITYPNGPDPGDVAIQYGTTGQPETVFITPRGRMLDKYALPFQDDATLARMIQRTRAS